MFERKEQLLFFLHGVFEIVWTIDEYGTFSEDKPISYTMKITRNIRNYFIPVNIVPINWQIQFT